MDAFNFTKMHGLGNDYVYVNAFEERITDAVAAARAVSDRHFGIGSDGLILIGPSERADVRMEMYNADGSRAQMCGNGIRCVAKYAIDHGLVTSRREVPAVMAEAAGELTLNGAIQVETDCGVLVLGLVDGRTGVAQVCVDMGEPTFAPAALPMNVEGNEVLDRPVRIGEREYVMTGVSVGNPHVIVFVDAVSAVRLAEEGPAIETDPVFPKRVNAHFVQVLGRGEMRMVTWERGSGATLACGTGATAVCVAAARTGRTDRRALIHLPGGPLRLAWAEDNHVFMTGPATEVFSGRWA
jgi:diaminopimelate epimerase